MSWLAAAAANAATRHARYTSGNDALESDRASWPRHGPVRERSAGRTPVPTLRNNGSSYYSCQRQEQPGQPLQQDWRDPYCQQYHQQRQQPEQLRRKQCEQQLGDQNAQQHRQQWDHQDQQHRQQWQRQQGQQYRQQQEQPERMWQCQPRPWSRLGSTQQQQHSTQHRQPQHGKQQRTQSSCRPRAQSVDRSDVCEMREACGQRRRSASDVYIGACIAEPQCCCVPPAQASTSESESECALVREVVRNEESFFEPDRRNGQPDLDMRRALERTTNRTYRRKLRRQLCSDRETRCDIALVARRAQLKSHRAELSEIEGSFSALNMSNDESNVSDASDWLDDIDADSVSFTSDNGALWEYEADEESDIIDTLAPAHDSGSGSSSSWESCDVAPRPRQEVQTNDTWSFAPPYAGLPLAREQQSYKTPYGTSSSHAVRPDTTARETVRPETRRTGAAPQCRPEPMLPGVISQRGSAPRRTRFQRPGTSFSSVDDASSSIPFEDEGAASDSSYGHGASLKSWFRNRAQRRAARRQIEAERTAALLQLQQPSLARGANQASQVTV